MARDPVCGMDVGESKGGGSSVYRGVTYCFCASGCKKEFDAGPEKHVGKG